MTFLSHTGYDTARPSGMWQTLWCQASPKFYLNQTPCRRIQLILLSTFLDELFFDQYGSFFISRGDLKYAIMFCVAKRGIMRCF